MNVFVCAFRYSSFNAAISKQCYSLDSNRPSIIVLDGSQAACAIFQKKFTIVNSHIPIATPIEIP